MIRRLGAVVCACLLLLGCSSGKARKSEAEKLYTAIYQGDIQTVHAIVEKTNINELPVLQDIPPQLLAAQTGNEDIAVFLLQKGAKVNVKDLDGETILHAAARNGNIHLAEYALEKKMDVNVRTKEGRTPLFEVLAPTSAQEDKTEMLQWLLQHGADKTAVTNTGWTVVHEAVYQKQPELLQSLLPSASVNTPNQAGITPLMVAVQENDEAAVSILLQNGAALEAEDEKGYTALCYGASYGLRQMSAALLQAGANPQHMTKNQQTCGKLAEEAGYTDIAALLQSR